MEITVATIAFLALILSWFVLPSQPRTAEAKTATTEALAPAA